MHEKYMLQSCTNLYEDYNVRSLTLFLRETFSWTNFEKNYFDSRIFFENFCFCQKTLLCIHFTKTIYFSFLILRNHRKQAFIEGILFENTIKYFELTSMSL